MGSFKAQGPFKTEAEAHEVVRSCMSSSTNANALEKTLFSQKTLGRQKPKHSKAGMERCGGLEEAPFFDDNPEFFKVFLPYTSSHRMSIPEAFIRNFKGVVPKKAILFDHSKKFWHVKLEQSNGRLFFNNGWQSFVIDHSLEFGDFLVFKYYRNSRFEVKIFSKDGCMKEVFADWTLQPGQDSKAKKACSRLVRDDKQKHMGISLKRNEEAGCSSKVGQHKSQRTLRTNSKENKFPKDFRFVAPKNPHYVLTITNFTKYFVHLPRLVLRTLNIKVKSNIVIHNQNGNMWPVKVNFHNNGRIYFGRGWRTFINENNVKVGDQCVFEFILRGENMCNEVHVHILHR